MRRQLGRILAASALCAVLGGDTRAAEPAPVPKPAAAPTADATTLASMAEIFAALRTLLPLSLDEARFRDPTRRDEILVSLALLEQSSSRLEQHGLGRDASFSFLARSLALQAQDIQERYAEGYVREAAFGLWQLTDTCVACHSRLPSQQDAPRSAAFVDERQVQKLPLEERAKLEYATRQFDRALTSYETLLASPEVSPNDLDLLGQLDDYLELCLRVRGDRARAAHNLEEFGKRPDLPEHLRWEVGHWVTSLRELEARTPKPDAIDEARALLILAGDTDRYADDRDGLVFFVEASSVLHRELASGPMADARAAEAYYLLGTIETRIGRSFWVSQAEPLLETAIRLAPGSPTAGQAFDLLEEFTVAGYTGSAGSHVPPDVAQRLDRLRRLARPAPAPPQGG